PEDPKELLQILTGDFTIIEAEVQPWQLYDIKMQLLSGFRLVDTAFETGKKLMVFQNKGRRLLIWHISLADIMLKRNALEVWVKDILNTCRIIRGPRFYIDADKQIRHRRSLLKRLGHFTELSRGCRAYQVEFRHDQEKNRIIIQVFNYRKDEDMEMLRGLEIR
ncbi:hypothetical protein ACFL4W_04495, partial [Planctomycetota bacterium]